MSIAPVDSSPMVRIPVSCVLRCDQKFFTRSWTVTMTKDEIILAYVWRLNRTDSFRAGFRCAVNAAINYSCAKGDVDTDLLDYLHSLTLPCDLPVEPPPNNDLSFPSENPNEQNPNTEEPPDREYL